MEETSLKSRLTDPELEQFVVATVQLTGKILGAGAYGSVEEVEIAGARVAAKNLHPQLVNLGSTEQVDKWVSNFIGECKLMSQLRHPHIVQFLGVCYLPGAPLPVLLMEKLETSLDNLLETNPNLPINVKVQLLLGTSRGLVYLHSRTPPIAHRDITARNILVDSSLNAKIADLGVARMVSIQPGQLLATMTHAPGTNLYMPPEATQEEGAARYNITIDVFSFGVVSLFTLTQTFPKSLKPASFFDSQTKRVSGRTEIERRADYIEPMKEAFGSSHPLVCLTLECLEYLPDTRPSSLEVSTRLEEFQMTLSPIKSKIELIQQVSSSEEIFDTKAEQKDKAIKNLEQEISVVKKNLIEKQLHSNSLQTSIDRLQSEKQNLVQSFEERTSVQQKQIDAQRIDVMRLSSQLKSVEMVRREEALLVQEQQKQIDLQRDDILQVSKQLQSVEMLRKEDASRLQEKQKQIDVQRKDILRLTKQLEFLKTFKVEEKEKEKKKAIEKKKENELTLEKVPLQSDIPTSITFNWRKCNKRLPDLTVTSQPVFHKNKLYVSGYLSESSPLAVLEYTFHTNKWEELVPPDIEEFAITTLQDRLLVVGGEETSSGKATDVILEFDDESRKWMPINPTLPLPLYLPSVVGFGNYLVVAGGHTSSTNSRVPNVSTLNMSGCRWTASESLPSTDCCKMAIIDNTVYLIGQETRTVMCANLQTLTSGVTSGVWEILPSVPFYYSSPIVVGNSLLVVGGRDSNDWGGDATTKIYCYDATSKKWIATSDLPEPMYYCCCIAIGNELFILGGFGNQSGYVAELVVAQYSPRSPNKLISC